MNKVNSEKKFICLQEERKNLPIKIVDPNPPADNHRTGTRR